MPDDTKTCELCGTPVRVVGDTTQHYEPLPPITDTETAEAVDTLFLWKRAMKGERGLPLRATDAMGLMLAIDTLPNRLSELSAENERLTAELAHEKRVSKWLAGQCFVLVEFDDPRYNDETSDWLTAAYEAVKGRENERHQALRTGLCEA